MGFFGLFGNREKKRPATEVSISPFTAVEGRVISAFTKVKQDITLLSSWLKYLRHKDMLHDQRHTKTQRELGEHKIHILQLKEEAAELKTAVKELKEELKDAIRVRERTETSPLTDLIRTKSELNPDRKRTYFENKVVTAIRSRRKDYVLKQILELAERGTYSTREIEEIVVGEKALCGRTAFYDYLRELKHKKMLKRHEMGSKKIIAAEKGSFEQVR